MIQEPTELSKDLEWSFRKWLEVERGRAGGKAQVPSQQFFQPEHFIYWSCEEKIKKTETCWCGGNLESRQSLHLHLGSHFLDMYITSGFSKHHFLLLQNGIKRDVHMK